MKPITPLLIIDPQNDFCDLPEARRAAGEDRWTAHCSVALAEEPAAEDPHTQLNAALRARLV